MPVPDLATARGYSAVFLVSMMACLTFVVTLSGLIVLAVYGLFAGGVMVTE